MNDTEKIFVNLSLIFLFLLSCSPQLFNLASEYGGNALYLDSFQKQLRVIFSDCDYDVDCFKDEADDYVKNTVCTEETFEKYGFVFIKECDRSSYHIVDTMAATSSQRQDSEQGNETEDLKQCLALTESNNLGDIIRSNSLMTEEECRAEERKIEEQEREQTCLSQHRSCVSNCDGLSFSHCMSKGQVCIGNCSQEELDKIRNTYCSKAHRRFSCMDNCWITRGEYAYQTQCGKYCAQYTNPEIGGVWSSCIKQCNKNKDACLQ